MSGFGDSEEKRQHGGKGTGGQSGEPRAASEEVDNLLGEEQRENAETFGERHTDDGLHEDLAGRAGIAADSFSGLVADETDADGGAEQTERAGDVTRNACGFSEEEVHIWWMVLVAVAAVRTRGTLPAVKDQWWAPAGWPASSWSSP